MLKQATPETIKVVEEKIRQENPEAFHVETGEHETLSKRTFMDEPCHPLPMAGFCYGYQPPAKKKADGGSEAEPEAAAEIGELAVTEG
ncbi:hypothetical protein [Caballeronia pedi]|nr:hypothetical protein [Caballeronia pedi]